MKAKELMIGDWVMNTYNRKPEQVCEIRERMAMLDYNDLYDYDEIADTFRFDCQPRYGYVQPSDEYQPNPFAIDSATRKRIMKFAASYATSAFYHKFGRQLMHINNAQRYERVPTANVR